MRIFIIFLAVLAVFCAVASTANFLSGNEFWGWVDAICVLVNLVNLSIMVIGSVDRN